jgi:serine/threonine protein kinase
LATGRRVQSQVRKFLSQGNFGAVWLVQDRATSELRVMKVPLRRIDIPLFMKEVELHRSLDSPFIVAFVESFEYDGWPVRPSGRAWVRCAPWAGAHGHLTKSIWHGAVGALGGRSRSFD